MASSRYRGGAGVCQATGLHLLPMCLGKLPLDAVPLSAEEEAAWVDSLQGDWDIDAVDLEAIAQTNNRYVKPIGFSKFRWYHAFERIAKGELCLSEVPFHGASLRRQMGLHAP